MPYAFVTHKIKLPRSKDRRFKLTPEDRESIRTLYRKGTPIRAIAREYEKKCSRRLVQMVIFPDRYEEFKKKARKWRKENGNVRKRVGNARWAEIMREHRRYKQKILANH